jgi:hypothetical protein
MRDKDSVHLIVVVVISMVLDIGGISDDQYAELKIYK